METTARLARALPLLAIALAGCLVGPGMPGTRTLPPPASAEDVAEDVVAAGTVTRYAGGFLANVSAHNIGTATYSYSQPYVCVGTPWTATLLGPNGDPVAYRNPNAAQPSCPTYHGQMAPGAWLNWTAHPTCTTYSACDNNWDGKLWDSRGDPHPAPEGQYTWRFQFRYYLSATSTADPTGERSRTVTLEYVLNWP